MPGRAGVAVACAAIGAAAVVTLFVLPSGASLTPADNCAVVGTVTPGRVRIEPAQSSGPFTIPLDGRVNWAATLTAPPPTEARAFDGALAIVGPGGFDSMFEGLLEFRTWSNDKSRRVQDAGIERYDLPSWSPRGVDIPIHGFQEDPLGGCRGEILVQIEGGRFESPLAWVAVGGTFFWLAVTLLAGKLRDDQQGLFCLGIVIPAFLLGWLLAIARSSTGGTPLVLGLVFALVAIVASIALRRQTWALDFWGGHPALGWFGGLLLGFFLSLDLFVFGIVRLDSSVLLYPPILGMIAGLAMAWWTPFRGRDYA
jgi:hypothetical protein